MDNSDELIIKATHSDSKIEYSFKTANGLTDDTITVSEEDTKAILGSKILKEKIEAICKKEEVSHNDTIEVERNIGYTKLTIQGREYDWYESSLMAFGGKTYSAKYLSEKYFEQFYKSRREELRAKEEEDGEVDETKKERSKRWDDTANRIKKSIQEIREGKRTEVTESEMEELRERIQEDFNQFIIGQKYIINEIKKICEEKGIEKREALDLVVKIIGKTVVIGNIEVRWNAACTSVARTRNYGAMATIAKLYYIQYNDSEDAETND